MKMLKISFLKFRYEYLIWITLALLYVFSLSQYPAYGDSGELLATSIRLGVAHPPGFPLYVFLGNIFHSIFPGTDAFRVGLLSCVCAVLCLQAVYRVLRSLCEEVELSVWIIWLSVGLLAVSTCFWRYAVHVEVISLNAMLFMFCLERCVRVLTKCDNGYRSFIWAVFWFSLGVANHHTIIFVLPCLVLAFVEVIGDFNWKRWALLCIVSMSFVFVYLLFAILSDPREPVSWRGFNTINDIIHVFFRKDYGTFDLGVGSDSKNQPLVYLKDLWERCAGDFGPFLLFFPFSLIPILRAEKDRKRLLLGMWCVLLCSTVLFFSRFNLPLVGYIRTNTIKFYVIPQLMIVLLSCYSMVYFLSRLKLKTRWSFSRPIGITLLLSVLIFVSLKRFPLVSARNDRNLIDYCEQTLSSLPENSLVIAGSDDVLFGCGVYLQQTKRFRGDTFIFRLPPIYRERRVLAELLQTKHFVKKTAFFSAEKDRPWAFALNLVENLPRTRIFLLDAQYGSDPDYHRMLQAYDFIPYGAAIEIVRKKEELDLDNLEQETRAIYSTYISHSGHVEALLETYPEEFHYGARLQTNLAQGWAELASLAQKHKRPDISFRALEQAIQWAPWVGPFYFAAAKVQQQFPEETPSDIEYIKLLDFASKLPVAYNHAVRPLGFYQQR